MVTEAIQTGGGGGGGGGINSSELRNYIYIDDSHTKEMNRPKKLYKQVDCVYGRAAPLTPPWT